MSSSTQPTTTIEDLPPEMVSELFEYVHLKDLAACSQVNKRWHSIYVAFKVHRLAAISNEYDYYEIFEWFDTNRPIREEERCCPTMFVRLVEKPLLSNLKHLALAGSLFEFDLNELNRRFPQLLHLEVNLDLYGKLHLNLPRLEVLVFHLNSICDLSIDCPRLSTLAYSEREGTTLLEVKQPETIRTLKTNMNGAKLAAFKSVECLVTCRYEMISTATLLSLPRLNELRYIQDIRNMFKEEFRHGTGTINGMRRTLSEFVKEAKRLRGSDFLFTFSGFELTNVNVDQIDFGVDVDERLSRVCVSNEYVYMNNYHLIIEPNALQFVERVRYDYLLSNLTGELPRCFFEKFTGINEVSVCDKVPDEEHFLWFLKSLRSLSELDLKSTELGQEFYDQLPASAPSLRRLVLEKGHCNGGLELNFDFIGKLSLLSDLEIKPKLSLEKLPSLVRSFGKLWWLEDCEFRVQSIKERIEIQKEVGFAEWNVWKADKVVFKTKNPMEILNFFKTSKGKKKKKRSKRR